MELCQSGLKIEVGSVLSSGEDRTPTKAEIQTKPQDSNRIGITGRLTLIFLPAEKGFYRDLRRKEFDSVFFRLLEEIPETHR